MTNSRHAGPRQVPPPPGARPSSSYSRFIPREELQGFANWQPGSLGGTPATPRDPVEAAPPDAGALAERHAAELKAARSAGYQDGYRDGLVALESFKQTFAQQATAQLGQLVQGFDRAFEALEQQMALTLARAATQLARQVVRDEVSAHPERVARVAQEAVHAVLMSARHVSVRVHPDDHPLVAHGAAEAIDARGARLIPDPAVQRGGVVVESDAGGIDARIATRWTQAAQALGTDVPWEGE